MDSVSPYQSHLNIVKRLRPADGHLRGIIEIGGLGLDNHQQLYAVETTIGQAKKTLTGDHVDHCTEVDLPGKSGGTF